MNERTANIQMDGQTDRQTNRIHIHHVYVGLAQACLNTT